MNLRDEARPLVLGAVLLLALGVFTALRARVSTDITHFLPDGRVEREVSLAKQLTAAEPTRTLVLLVDAPTTEAAAEASRAFEDALRAEPRVARELASLDGGTPTGIEEAFWELYHPRRFGFFADSPAAVRERTTAEALRASAANLKARLASPVSGLISRVAPDDPTLVLPGLFERLQDDRGNGVEVVDGRLVTADGGAAVLFLTTRSPAMDAPVQRPVLEGVRAAFETVAAASDVPLSLSLSGAARFAVASEAAFRRDIARVSLGSTLGLAALLLFVFRSFRLVLLVLPVIAAGYLAGTSACLALFGTVHGLTLAFGAAMIGVSVDYAVHFHCHQVLAPHPSGPRGTLRALWPGLALGAATTMAGFVALLASSFPGLQELAVFSTAGIAAALFATRFFFPALAVRRAPPAATARAAAAVTRALSGRRSRALLAVPTVVVVGLALAGLPGVRWDDRLAALNREEPELLAEDEAVRERVTRYEQRRLVVAVGADAETALQVNDLVADELEEARASGELGGWRSLATLLPSAERQRAVDAALRADPGLWTRVRHALVAEGFVAAGFEPFREALAAEPPAPLRLDDLESSPLAPLARPFRVSLGEEIGFLSFVHDLADEDALAERIADVPGAYLIDIEGVLTGAYARYREQMAWLTAVGLAAVLALVVLRHRALRPTLVACVPAFLAVAGTIGVVSLFGLALNVLSLVALLMVVSMGVDYGVFLAECRGVPEEDAHLQATHLAIFVAAASTLLGFGLLAFSVQPALLGIGITSGVGVFLCFVLAPTWNALLAPRS